MSLLAPIHAVWFGQPVGIERPLGLWLAALFLGLATVAALRSLRSRGATKGWVTVGREGVLVTQHWHGRRALRLALGGIATASFALAWAGPTVGQTQQHVTHRGIDLVVALDASRSMLVGDVIPSRLTAARAAVEQLLGELGGDRVGVVAFARDAFVQAPLTTDYGAARLYLRAVDPLQMQQGGTALAGALREAAGMFRRAEHGAHDRAVLLVSDGEDWEGGAVEEARALAASGVHVYTLGVGTREGAPVPILDPRGRLVGYEKDARGTPVVTRPNPEALAAIAAAGNGQAFFEDGAVDVGPIARRVDALRKGELDSGTRVTGVDRYQWLTLPGVLLLVLALGLGEAPPRKAGRRARRSGAMGGVVAAAALGLLAVAPRARAAGPFESADPDVHQGLAAYGKGDYATAAKAFARAEAQGRSTPVAAFDRGVALYKAGQADEALKAFARAASPTLQGRDAYNAGVAQASLQRRDDAIKSFRAALQVDPGNEDARHNLEVLLEQQKQDQEQQKQDQKAKVDERQGSKKPKPQRAKKEEAPGRKPELQQATQQQHQPQPQPQQPPQQQGQARASAGLDGDAATPKRSEAERTLDQLKQGERLLPIGRVSTVVPEVEHHEHTW